jgi:hypothetical protein
MVIDLREWLHDLYQYKLTLLYVLGQLAFARRAPGCEHRLHATRPAADLACFVPVYVWGLESLHHLAWWLFEDHGFCWGLPIGSFFPRCFLSSLVLFRSSRRSSASNGRGHFTCWPSCPTPT